MLSILHLPKQLIITLVVQDFNLFIDVLLLDFRGTMKRLGYITWHLSRKLISLASLSFLTTVGNTSLLFCNVMCITGTY